ncbi:PDZ domain-containing protein [Salibacterium salarium]|uniref:PDZ domain-containing protein n=1 Tax=Salibacterium salarium TaxID=284579 RepID=A0A428MXJ8_9BACI|nr:PDZ domain-containing protein [Salibacterium salarium]RSL30779.1 PDZ domain-containing protein [Salibacterium salarium]
MDVIGWELVQAVGRFFAHPLTYIIPIAMLLLGYIRVKRERSTFHTRMYQAAFDVTAPLLPGFMAGLVLSIIVVAGGIAVPFAFIGLLSIVLLLVLLTGRTNWLSPAFTVSLTVILALFLPAWESGNAFVDSWLEALAQTDFRPIMIWLSALIMIEGVLIWKNGKHYTSPVVLKSTRGKWLGAHRLQRIWLIPSVMFVPDGVIESVSWWPLLPVGENGLTLFLIPFAIGTKYTIFHTLPAPAVKRAGQRVILLGILAGAGAAAVFYDPQAALYTAAFAIVFRESLTVWLNAQERTRPAFFMPRSRGVGILGVLPESPAAKVGLRPGEMIMKVNGQKVNTEKDFYQALQKNSAYCKVEVTDIQGELRHVQSALYDNEHHEMGVLLVKDRNAHPPAAKEA